MKSSDRSRIEELAHLYVDGAFDRRELLRRVVCVTGSIATATVALESVGLAHSRDEVLCACPEDVRVPEDARDLEVIRQVEFPGEAGGVFAHQARPRRQSEPLPGILVIHENRGLNEHIRDVTRRAARAGFVAVGVDLLSRFGGTPADPEEALRLYQQTTVAGRLSDMLSALAYLKGLDFVQGDRLGAVGFCAGGGNCWRLALSTDAALSAAVPFYGSPVPLVNELGSLGPPVLAIYAELDRNLTRMILPVILGLEDLMKPFSFHVYEGVGHAFHNDTGPNYQRAAACDAWCKTVAFFQRHLN